MSGNKNARQVNYFLKRAVHEDGNSKYWLHISNIKMHLIEKKEAGWFAGSCYHQTLRDAIIYCLYGV